jgi:hypothetical protein
MGPYEFEPIVLKYEGLEADHNQIDLGQLGQSIQGAARLLASAGTLVETGQYVKKAPAMSVRVVAGLRFFRNYCIHRKHDASTRADASSDSRCCEIVGD